MKIGIVCPYDLGAPGGVQRVCLDLASRFRERGDDVVVGAPGVGDGWVSLGSVVPIVANGSRVPLSLSPMVSRRIRAHMSDVDVLHVHEPFIPTVGWAGVKTDHPTVVTFHADPPVWARRLYSMLGPAGGSMLGGASITAVSRVAASAIPESWGHVEIVPNAVAVDDYRIEVPRWPKRVVFLGRDEPRKGLDVVLEAWPAVLAAHPDAELVVIGASRLDGPDGVEFVGRLREPEKRSLLASSSVFVAPNLGGESFGIVLAEALASGCAVLASDLEAFRAVADHAALYSAPGDSREWAEQLIVMLGSQDLIESLRIAGRRVVKRFDWSVVLDRYHEVYAATIGA